MGYKTSAYFAARLTSPPAPLRVRGELDTDTSGLFSYSNSGLFFLVR